MKIILAVVALVGVGVLISVMGYKTKEKSMSNNQNFTQEDSSLFSALSSPESSARVLQLIKEGADVNAKDSVGKTALITATERNLPQVVKLLIPAGADVNAKDKEERTALLLAVEAGYSEIVKILLAAQADVPYKQATDLAKKQGHQDIWKLLIYNSFPPLIEREGVFNTPKERNICWRVPTKQISWG